MATQYSKLHESPAGPGDARPTAAQILQDQGLEGKWQDKVIFITGCSSGLGVETARGLAQTGAILYLTARDLEKAKAALGDLADSDRVHLLQVDLNSLESVRMCASEFNKKSSKLNILIENAGVMMTPESTTAEGFESQFGINHLAHFLLFQLLKPAMLASITPGFNSRVIVLSSIGHRAAEPDLEKCGTTDSYNPWMAYGRSKTANIWTAYQIERLYGSQGLHAWSVQPGPTGTPLYRHMSEADVAASASDPALGKIFKTVAQGAATTVWGATAAALEGQGGKYLEDCQISEKWDESAGQWAPGHAAWAYDDEKASKLWAKSFELVRLDG
jgi:NAD(P)-dependent dehydrogenase (short-subunit alcohol dehydrogenase family)